LTTDKRFTRLSKRFDTPGTSSKERIPSSPERSNNKPDRARQSLHFANQSIKDLDDAYRLAEHNVFPRKLNKANFIEALISVGIRHADEVVSLALEQQSKEEGE